MDLVEDALIIKKQQVISVKKKIVSKINALKTKQTTRMGLIKENAMIALNIPLPTATMNYVNNLLVNPAKL
jgi:hypothetical protein